MKYCTSASLLIQSRIAHDFPQFKLFKYLHCLREQYFSDTVSVSTEEGVEKSPSINKFIFSTFGVLYVSSPRVPIPPARYGTALWSYYVAPDFKPPPDLVDGDR